MRLVTHPVAPRALALLHCSVTATRRATWSTSTPCRSASLSAPASVRPSRT